MPTPKFTDTSTTVQPAITKDQAALIFRTLFTDHKEEALTYGILLWLGKLEDLAAFRTFLSLPRLMQQYSMDELLQSKAEIPGVAASLFFLITSCWKLFGERLHQLPGCDWPLMDTTQNEYIRITEIVDRISLGDFWAQLLSSIMSIADRQHRKELIGTMEPYDIPTQETALKNDRLMKDHVQLMIWLSLMRHFLSAVYCYFEKENRVG